MEMPIVPAAQTAKYETEKDFEQQRLQKGTQNKRSRVGKALSKKKALKKQQTALSFVTNT